MLLKYHSESFLDFCVYCTKRSWNICGFFQISSTWIGKWSVNKRCLLAFLFKRKAVLENSGRGVNYWIGNVLAFFVCSRNWNVLFHCWKQTFSSYSDFYTTQSGIKIGLADFLRFMNWNVLHHLFIDRNHYY